MKAKKRIIKDPKEILINGKTPTHLAKKVKLLDKGINFNKLVIKKQRELGKVK